MIFDKPIYRTYECGTRTVELPEVVLSYMHKGVLEKTLQSAKQAAARRVRDEEIRAMFAEGWKIAAIASETGLHHTTVRAILGPLRKAAAEQRRKAMELRYARIRELRDTGMSMPSIAKAVGMAQSTVSRALAM